MRRTPVAQLTLPTELLAAIDRWAAAESRKRLGARVSRSQAVRELCTTALEKSALRVRKYRLGGEPEVDEDIEQLSPAERVAMMGELALAGYKLRGDDVAPGIRRDVVRVVRGKGGVRRRGRVRGRRSP